MYRSGLRYASNIFMVVKTWDNYLLHLEAMMKQTYKPREIQFGSLYFMILFVIGHHCYYVYIVHKHIGPPFKPMLILYHILIWNRGVAWFSIRFSHILMTLSFNRCLVSSIQTPNKTRQLSQQFFACLDSLNIINLGNCS